MDKNTTSKYKAIAILSVIICHAMGTFAQGRITWFTPLGGVGVAIFLLLSAYGLNESWNKLETGGYTRYWWRKRFITVWIPYIIVQLIAYWPFHEFRIDQFILDVTLIKPLYQNGWYLQHLFMWYMIFYIVRRIDALDKHRVLIFTIVSVITFFTLREIKAEQSLSFLAGILLSERKEFREKLFKPRWGIILMAFGIGCLAIKQLSFIRTAPQIIMNLVQLGIKLPAGLGLMVLAHSVLKKWKLTVLYWIGLISYELYLVHGYVLSAVPVSVAGAVLFVVITALISFAFWWTMKKLKPVWYRCFRVVM